MWTPLPGKMPTEWFGIDEVGRGRSIAIAPWQQKLPGANTPGS